MRSCGAGLQREEDRKKEGSKVIEVRRPPGQGRGRGERTGRQSDRGNERAHDRGRSGNGHDLREVQKDWHIGPQLKTVWSFPGSRTLPPVSASKPQENGTVGSEVSGDWDQPSVEEDKPVAPPSIPRYLVCLLGLASLMQWQMYKAGLCTEAAAASWQIHKGFLPHSACLLPCEPAFFVSVEEVNVKAARLCRPTYSRAPGPASASSDHVHSETVRPPITAAGGGGPTMADLFKKPPPSPTPPPAAIAPPTSSLQPQKHLLDEPTPQTDLVCPASWLCSMGSCAVPTVQGPTQTCAVSKPALQRKSPVAAALPVQACLARLEVLALHSLHWEEEQSVHRLNQFGHHHQR